MTSRATLAAACVIAVLALTCRPVGAQALDTSSQEALGTVLRMLQEPAARGAAIAGDARAGAADTQIQSLTHGSPALTQEVYELAAQIFEDIARSAGGDVQAINQILARAQADPASLTTSLSPATLARLRALAEKLSAPPAR
ncbi:MAG TPA: hypothetical protein VMQ51_20925 [Candidatus Binatia bacterium]|nr:hypothetical protein [Candidatus Binatia bacterium]